MQIQEVMSDLDDSALFIKDFMGISQDGLGSDFRVGTSGSAIGTTSKSMLKLKS